MRTFLQRIVDAALLRARAYEDVEKDSRATLHAAAVIVLGAMAAGVGALGWDPPAGTAVPFSIVVGGLGLVTWVSWAILTVGIGGHLMPEPQTRVNVGEVLRTTGFSAAPALLLPIGALGATTFVFLAIAAAWMPVTMILAVRQALDFTTTRRAVAVCLIGWLITLAFVAGLGMLLGPELGGLAAGQAVRLQGGHP